MDDNIEISVGNTRSFIGKVVSAKRNKTVSVLIERRVKHPKYGKYIRRSKKFHAHDDVNRCREGDIVEIQECPPKSKTKNWIISRVVQSVPVE